MKVTTINMAGPNNALETPGTTFERTEETFPTLEAAMEYINEHVQRYYLGDISYIPVIKSIEDTSREQFVADVQKGIAAFGNALNNPNNVAVKKVNGVWTYRDSYPALNGGRVEVTLEAQQKYGPDGRYH
jgi:hypothetical protein